MIAGRPLAILHAMARASQGMHILAVEKIHEESREDPFQVLIATMLSAQTKDAVTEAASAQLFGLAPDPQTLARLAVRRIERLIFPVSFYRTKARHVKEACSSIGRPRRRKCSTLARPMMP
jgi:endonuclease III